MVCFFSLPELLIMLVELLRSLLGAALALPVEDCLLKLSLPLVLGGFLESMLLFGYLYSFITFSNI